VFDAGQTTKYAYETVNRIRKIIENLSKKYAKGSFNACLQLYLYSLKLGIVVSMGNLCNRLATDLKKEKNS
jgi:uncharacterized protein with FMN-binding domain